MHVQPLNSGKTMVNYGKPVPYQSPLRIDQCYPSVVTYSDSKTGEHVGKVYKDAEGRWYLRTRYINSDIPFEVFTKYDGFLFLNKLHRNQ